MASAFLLVFLGSDGAGIETPGGSLSAPPAATIHDATNETVREPVGSPEAGASVVATVNGESITRMELDRALKDPLTLQWLREGQDGGPPKSGDVRDLALQMLIRRRLILQEARSRGITVSDQEIDDAVVALRRQFVDLDAFGLWMRERGIDDRSLFSALRAELLAARIIEDIVEDVSVTQDQVRQYYDENRDAFARPGDVRLRIIAVRDEFTMEEIVEALRGGADFGRLAEGYSQGLRADQGGDTGWVNPTSLPVPLYDVVKELKPGDVYGPLRNDGAFLVVRLEARRPPQIQEFGEARPEAERRLLSLRRRAFLQTWLDGQIGKAAIEVFSLSRPPDMDETREDRDGSL